VPRGCVYREGPMDGDIQANPIAAAGQYAQALRETSTKLHKKRWGQYFTPPALALFMASLVELEDLGDAPAPLRILDPGAGTGIMGLSLATRALREHPTRRVELIAVETEAAARDALARSLTAAKQALGPMFSFSVLDADVLELATGGTGAIARFHVAIANPPYYKMSPGDPRGGDAPNIYARFMEVASELLHPGGALCFVVPRSFASGHYFRRFRARFHQTMQLRRVHVFDSRAAAFRDDAVLQENIVVLYAKHATQQASSGHAVTISCSHGLRDLAAATRLTAPARDVVGVGADAMISLPTTKPQLDLLRAIRGWPMLLSSLGLQVSTGPIVPFRSTPFLADARGRGIVPLLWLQHVSANGVTWPLGRAFRKPEHVRASIGENRLVANHNYVLLRRFSAKEDRRRLTAAAYLATTFDDPAFGLENHLNYIHRAGGMSAAEAIGLAALLQSATLDEYVRISSGNTQVSAAELRALPLPRAGVIREIARATERKRGSAAERIEQIIARSLEHGAR
jgi:adenine-specific DNA-methyltransferase